jgi:hypothetical protein
LVPCAAFFVGPTMLSTAPSTTTHLSISFLPYSPVFSRMVMATEADPREAVGESLCGSRQGPAAPARQQPLASPWRRIR